MQMALFHWPQRAGNGVAGDVECRQPVGVAECESPALPRGIGCGCVLELHEGLGQRLERDDPPVPSFAPELCCPLANVRAGIEHNGDALVAYDRAPLQMTCPRRLRIAADQSRLGRE